MRNRGAHPRARYIVRMRWLTMVGLGILIVAPTTPAVAEDAGASLSCVSVTSDARYVPYGYNHVVILKNACQKDAICTVSTDVNPEPTSVTVPRGQTVEVITFSGSPARTFVPRVSCKSK